MATGGGGGAETIKMLMTEGLEGMIKALGQKTDTKRGSETKFEWSEKLDHRVSFFSLPSSPSDRAQHANMQVKRGGWRKHGLINM